MSKLFPTYDRWPVEAVSGKGVRVRDTEGRTYLDFTSGIGVTNLGHTHPDVTAAVERQLGRIWHTSNLFKSSLQEEVAAKLTKPTKLNRVFFCNSGAEANEAAIKLARRYTGKHTIITFEKSFHGRTFAAMSATGQEKIKKGFGPLLPSFRHVPYGDLEAFAAALNEDVAAVIVEVVQGEGGVRPGDSLFLQKVSQLCRQYDILLIVDEVQTGIGRTGYSFAYLKAEIDPDIITCAKALANGIPCGAMLAKETFSSSFGFGSHGTTFGGNPIAMAAATTVLDIVFTDAFLREVRRKGEILLSQFKSHFAKRKNIVDVRGLGLMVGIEFTEDVAETVAELRRRGLLVLTAGSKVIRLLPPLIVTDEEISEALEQLSAVI